MQDKKVSSVEEKFVMVHYCEVLSDISKMLWSCCELGLWFIYCLQLQIVHLVMKKKRQIRLDT